MVIDESLLIAHASGYRKLSLMVIDESLMIALVSGYRKQSFIK
jgi:hypothetical protein